MHSLPNRTVFAASAAAAIAALAGCGDAPAPSPPVAHEAHEEAPEAAAEPAPRPVATLASGALGGTYHERYAREIDDRVGDWTIEARTTAGSTENLDLLSEGEVDLALAQADVFASRVAEEPEVFAPLRLLALLNEECVFVAYRVGSAVDELADLAKPVGDRDAVIGIGPAGGGMAETWNHLSSVLPEQANAAVDRRDGPVAMNALASGEIDAVAWITDPKNAEHVLLRAVQADPDLRLLDVEDERLFDLLAGDTDVYLPRTLAVSDGERESVETICTPGLLMASPTTPQALIDALAAAGFRRM